MKPVSGPHAHPARGVVCAHKMVSEEESRLLRRHKALGLGGTIFLQKRGADLMCENWSYFLPLMVSHRICIQCGSNHSERVYFRSSNPCWAFLPLCLIKDVFSSEKTLLLRSLYQHRSHLLAFRELLKSLKGNHDSIHYWMKCVSFRASCCWVISWKWFVLSSRKIVWVLQRRTESNSYYIDVFPFGTVFILNPEKITNFKLVECHM